MTSLVGPAHSSLAPREKSRRTDESICFSSPGRSLLSFVRMVSFLSGLAGCWDGFPWTGTLPLVCDGASRGVSNPTGEERETCLEVDEALQRPAHEQAALPRDVPTRAASPDYAAPARGPAARPWHAGTPVRVAALRPQLKAEGPVTQADPPVRAVSAYSRQALTGVAKIHIGPKSFVGDEAVRSPS